MKPLLIVVSAPSGAGKTTLCKRLLDERDDVVYSVSCTTRPPRGNEEDGKDYIFLSRETFEDKISRGCFLECATVHGHYYGTLRKTVQDAMDRGLNVLMDIDVQGARKIRSVVERMPEDHPMRVGFFDIFIEPPSLEALRQRLEARAEDAPEVIEKRVAQAQAEMEERHLYDECIVNDDLEQAYRRFKACILAEMNLD